MNIKKDLPILEIFKQKKLFFSLEFFPPKDEAGIENLKKTAHTLKEINPDFVSVTYGAGGSTREKTTELCKMLRKEFHFTVMPHLTCVGSTQKETLEIIKNFYNTGVRNIMALRGDLPKGAAGNIFFKDGLLHANDLVALIHKNYPDICIGVAGYPEKHPEASSIEEDLKNLKHKVDQGAHFITTQLFFENHVYYDFVERCRKIGIQSPIVPGIMPVLSFKQIQRIAELCKANLPKKLVADLEKISDDDAEAAEEIGTAWAAHQIKDLIENGVPGVHLYILNRAHAAISLAKELSQNELC